MYIVWKHGDAYAVRTKNWSKRMYGFATRAMAYAYASNNWKG